jgi:hypothetical protein
MKKVLNANPYRLLQTKLATNVRIQKLNSEVCDGSNGAEGTEV